MVTRRAPAGKKPKVKKETLRDLDPKGKAGKVKGGIGAVHTHPGPGPGG